LRTLGKTVEAFDVMDRMPLYYSMALGAGETTLLRLTAAYAMIDNNGHWLLPSIIDTVQDRDGKIIYQKGVGACASCFIVAGPRNTSDNSSLYRPNGVPDTSVAPFANAQYAVNPIIYKSTKPDPLVDTNADAQIISMMEGVVQRGTGTAVAAVGKPIAGKTGTTSDFFDAWFVGFSPGLAAGAYVGFDNPRTLGDGEVGGKVAAPVFRDFMAAVLKDQPATPFPGTGGGEIAGNGTPSATGGGTADPATSDALLKTKRQLASLGAGAKRLDPSDDSVVPLDSAGSSQVSDSYAPANAGWPPPPPPSYRPARQPVGAYVPPPPAAMGLPRFGTGGLY
jgi:penicillin-binding protein 1A